MYVTWFRNYVVPQVSEKIQMAAVIDVTETEDLELGDLSAEPIHRQPTEFSWHTIAVNRRREGQENGSASNGLSGTAGAGRLFAIMGPS